MHIYYLFLALVASAYGARMAPAKRRAQALHPRQLSRRGMSKFLATPRTLAHGSLDASQGCTAFDVVKRGDSCNALVKKFKMPGLQAFLTWNPSVSSGCSNLIAGRAYCVKGPAVAVSTSTSIAASTSPVITPSSVPTSVPSRVSATSPSPSPPAAASASPSASSVAVPSGSGGALTADLAPGSLNATGGCTAFGVARSGDFCNLIVQKYDIPDFQSFFAWNPSVGSDCSQLIAGLAYCVAGPAASDTSNLQAPSPVPTGITLAGLNSGDATWFDAGLGACGSTVDGAKDSIVAVSHILFDGYPGATANPNVNPICGRQMQVSYGSKKVTVTVQDRCEGCALTDVDLSIVAFQQLAKTSVGRMPVTWTWL